MLNHFLLNSQNNSNKEQILSIASEIQTPLALASLFIIISYLIYKLLFRSHIFSKMTRKGTFSIIDKLISYIFILSLVLSILGFLGFISEKFLSDNSNKSLNNKMTMGIGKMRYNVKNHRFEASATFNNLKDIDINFWNLYLGINKYNEQSDRLNQKYVLVGPFNLRNNINEQHITLGKNMTEYFKTGGQIRVCYFLIDKSTTVNINNFIPSQYSTESNLKEICGVYGFDKL